MVTSVNSSTTSTTSTTSSTTSTSLSASYEMFLQLLTTQLQTQDPLDPVDSTEFTQQLATYAGLEQQLATNEKLDEVISGLDLMSLSTGVGYLGHSVEANGDTLSVSDDGGVDAGWKYTLASDASEVTLTVVNSDGDTVWTGAGDASSGSHGFSWDGTDSDGNPVDAGDYTLKVAATTANGAAVTSAISIVGTVTAIDSSSGSAVLELGDTRVDLDDVTRLAA